jgi:hypothetical protein
MTPFQFTGLNPRSGDLPVSRQAVGSRPMGMTPTGAELGAVCLLLPGLAASRARQLRNRLIITPAASRARQAAVEPASGHPRGRGGVRRSLNQRRVKKPASPAHVTFFCDRPATGVAAFFVGAGVVAERSVPPPSTIWPCRE